MSGPVTLVRNVRLRVPAASAKPGPAIGQVRNSTWNFHQLLITIIIGLRSSWFKYGRFL
jgi:hypothetical protein